MKPITDAEALELLGAQGGELTELFSRATAARLATRGAKTVPCAIINAKSGHCGQDCAFCAQSRRSTASYDKYPLKSRQEIFDLASAAAGFGAQRIGIVTSGRRIAAAEDVQTLADAVTQIRKELPLLPCASLGIVKTEVLDRLKDAGLDRYHHNLETAESFYPKVCTTRRWKDSLPVVEQAAERGLRVCCGGLFGLGESLKQRVELLGAVSGLPVDCVPINFLHPIEGTPLADTKQLDPLACLRIVAVARLMMPHREIRVCGGREHNLRDLQSWLLLAGADGLMVGGYLTTSGRKVSDDLQMISDAGLSLAQRS